MLTGRALRRWRFRLDVSGPSRGIRSRLYAPITLDAFCEMVLNRDMAEADVCGMEGTKPIVLYCIGKKRPRNRSLTVAGRGLQCAI